MAGETPSAATEPGDQLQSTASVNSNSSESRVGTLQRLSQAAIGLQNGQFSTAAWGEISHTARQTRDASTHLLKWLQLDAERRLGIEVNITDPALQSLFESILQVETLLNQALVQAKALFEGAHLLGEVHKAPPPPTANVQAKFASVVGTMRGILLGPESSIDSKASFAKDLADFAARPCNSASNGQLGASRADSVSACTESLEVIKDAEWNTLHWSPNAGGGGGSTRYRLERRLQEEVVEPIERQMEEHDKLRSLMREQQTWRHALESSRREVATLSKRSNTQSGGTSSQQLDGSFGTVSRLTSDSLRESVVGAGPAKEAVGSQFAKAQTRVKELDQAVFAKLLDIKARARNIVLQPWAALAQIRKQFFTEVAGQWGPAATLLTAPDEESRRARARDLSQQRAEAAKKATAGSAASAFAAAMPRIGEAGDADDDVSDDDDDDLPRIEQGATFQSKEDGTHSGTTSLKAGGFAADMAQAASLQGAVTEDSTFRAEESAQAANTEEAAHQRSEEEAVSNQAGEAATPQEKPCAGDSFAADTSGGEPDVNDNVAASLDAAEAKEEAEEHIEAADLQSIRKEDLMVRGDDAAFAETPKEADSNQSVAAEEAPQVSELREQAAEDLADDRPDVRQQEEEPPIVELSQAAEPGPAAEPAPAPQGHSSPWADVVAESAADYGSLNDTSLDSRDNQEACSSLGCSRATTCGIEGAAGASTRDN